MKSTPLRKLNLYMRPEQKAALQQAAANAGMSVSAWSRQLVQAALVKQDQKAQPTTDPYTAPPTPSAKCQKVVTKGKDGQLNMPPAQAFIA